VLPTTWASRTWPPIAGFAGGAATGAALYAAVGIDSLALPTALALMALGFPGTPADIPCWRPRRCPSRMCDPISDAATSRSRGPNRWRNGESPSRTDRSRRFRSIGSASRPSRRRGMGDRRLPHDSRKPPKRPVELATPRSLPPSSIGELVGVRQDRAAQLGRVCVRIAFELDDVLAQCLGCLHEVTE